MLDNEDGFSEKLGLYDGISLGTLDREDWIWILGREEMDGRLLGVRLGFLELEGCEKDPEG